MTPPQALHFDSSEAATRHAITASGRDPKDVGHALWPDKSPPAARTALLNALNESRAERLTADQHLFVARYCGDFSWLYYVCARANHSRPVLQAPENRALEILQRVDACKADLRGLLAQLENLPSTGGGR